METLLEVSNKLFNYFQQNNILDIENETHFNLIFPSTENIVFHKAILNKALESFEKADLITKVNYIEKNKEKFFWILNKPFDLYDQNISLNGTLCLTISNILNTFAGQSGNEDLFCDAKNIKSEDISNLIALFNEILQNLNKTEKEEE